MRKSLMAAAGLAIAAAAAPGFVGQSQAASTKSAYCDLAKNQRNIPSWNEHYACLGPKAKQAVAREPAPTRTSANARGKSEYCDLAKNQRNVPSWNGHY